MPVCVDKVSSVWRLASGGLLQEMRKTEFTCRSNVMHATVSGVILFSLYFYGYEQAD